MKTTTHLRKEDICPPKWIKRQTSPKSISGTKSLNIIDLFCGCGGMSLGIYEGLRLNKIESKILLALDNNQEALNVYQNNISLEFDSAVGSDIQELIDSNLRSQFSEKEQNCRGKYFHVDILVAGPPCQGHSSLNNHTRSSDHRNLLYLKAIRFAEITQPKVVIIENVANVVNDKDRVAKQGEELLKELGYSTYTFCADMHNQFGLAQTRKRHMLVAVLGETFDISNILQESKDKHSLKDYISDITNEYKEKKDLYYQPSLTTEVNKKRIEYLFENDLYNLPNDMRPKCHQKSHSYVSMYGRLHWEEPSQTITSGFGSMGQGRYVHPSEKRTITPHEAARIQGFPDFFNFESVRSRGELHTMIANAVPPKIMATIINELIQQGVL